MAKVVKEKKVRPFWQKIVSAYFDFCREKFGENPSFDGAAPRDLGMIVDSIEKKAIEKKIEWTEDVALRSINIFLEFSFQDAWLQNNFLLLNLNRQKDKIFFKIKMEIDGKSKSTPSPTNYKTLGQDKFADRLEAKLTKE